jgi:hypothetical protein
MSGDGWTLVARFGALLDYLEHLFDYLEHLSIHLVP